MTRDTWPRQDEQTFKAHDILMAQRAQLADMPLHLIVAELERRLAGRVAVIRADGRMIEALSVPFDAETDAR